MSGGMFECWAGQGRIPHFGQVRCTLWNTQCPWPHLLSACGQGWCLKYLPTRVAWTYQPVKRWQPAWQTGLPRWKWKSLSHVLHIPRNSPDQNTGMGSHYLPQGIFPTQGSNPGLPHCMRILYQLSHVKNPPANAGDSGLITGWGRSPGEENGNPFQYSCLKNPMDKEAWQATVHGIAESDMTSNWAHTHKYT